MLKMDLKTFIKLFDLAEVIICYQHLVSSKENLSFANHYNTQYQIFKYERKTETLMLFNTSSNFMIINLFRKTLGLSLIHI